MKTRRILSGRPGTARRHGFATAVTLVLGLGVASLAVGQDAAIEEIQVTGSRITRSTMETPTPVTTMDAQELSAMAPGNLIEGLAQMPQFYANLTPDGVNGGQNAGGSNVNLRGAGTNRTLTLLNGRRVVPSNRFGTVDVNLFPEDLLRSVETVTGGASAGYGTDAVAGVVNFILDTDYEGIKTHAQGGLTDRRDGATWEAGIAFGHDFNNGLHILGSVAAFDQAPMASLRSLQERDYLLQQARVTNPDPANGPYHLILPYVRPTNHSNTGLFISSAVPALNRLEINPDGSVAPIPYNGQGTLNSGCFCYSDPANAFDVEWLDRDLNNGFERENAFLYMDYDVNDTTTLFLQGIWADNSAWDRRESISLLSGWQGRVFLENPFLPDPVRQIMTANNLTQVDYGFFALNHPDTPLGESGQFTDNEMYSVTGGFKTEIQGGFFDGWEVDAYVQYGENIQDFVCKNCVRVDRMPIALDAVPDPVTGQPICRVNLPQFTGPVASGGNGGIFSGCQPINTFGGAQNISQGAADWIMDRDNKVARQWTDQTAFEVVMNGELFSGFGAGSIDAAFGAAYREENFDQRTVDPSDEYPALPDGRLLSDLGVMPADMRGILTEAAGGIPGVRFVPTGYAGDANSSSVLFSSLRELSGSFDVKEAFAEFNVPLLNGHALADYLEASLAARWADYEGSGEIWAWKVGLNWTINEEWRIRATSSRDVRAATLRERYDQTRGGINVANPWDNNRLVSAASLSGGNPSVTPEEADTYTAGFVYQPNWFDGFSASLDWYSIDINDAIAQLGTNNIVAGCFNGDLTLCNYVITPSGPVTNPTSPGFRDIIRVENIFINLANLRMSGMDMEMTYRTDVNWFGNGDETLSWRFLASWLEENSSQNKGAIRDDVVGEVPFVDTKVTTNITYSKGPYRAFLQARWIDGGLRDRRYVESAVSIPASAKPAGSILSTCGPYLCTIDDNSLPSVTYWDMRLSGNFGREENIEVFANINNLLDKAPPLSPGLPGRTGIGVSVNSLYDILGRRFTVGVNYEF